MAGARRYRAFISYSHTRDQPPAAALACALERFARPWWKLRAMRVFVDQHGLNANAALWKTIERALGASDWLLLASPADAPSPWVCQEVAWRLAYRSPERILIALTDGSIVWQGRGFDAAFRVAFLRIGAPLHGLASPDDLWNEHGWRWRQMISAVAVAAGALALTTWGVWRVDRRAHALAWSSDGTRLALAAGGERVRLWDSAAARPLAHWPAPGGTAALDFNRDGETTVAKWMLAIAPHAAPVQIVDPAEPSRGVALDRTASAAGFVASGRCLAPASGDAAVDVVSGFGFVRLFGLAGGTGTVRAMALGATEHFAVLRDGGRVALHVQPLCGDAEALSRFADARLAGPMTEAERLRHLPPPARTPVSQPPGAACSALAARVLPDWR